MVVVPVRGNGFRKKSVRAIPLHPAAAPIADDCCARVNGSVGLPMPLYVGFVINGFAKIPFQSWPVAFLKVIRSFAVTDPYFQTGSPPPSSQYKLRSMGMELSISSMVGVRE